MYKKIISLAFASTLFAGCVSVPMESVEKSDSAKQFKAPADGNSGVYIYRSGSFGGALTKAIWIDDKCIGRSAPNVFFYEEVSGDTEHKVSTESEFSPNDLMVNTESGKNYFIQQYIKMGAFVGGADLKLVNEEEGKAAIQNLKMAKKGECTRPE